MWEGGRKFLSGSSRYFDDSTVFTKDFNRPPGIQNLGQSSPKAWWLYTFGEEPLKLWMSSRMECWTVTFRVPWGSIMLVRNFKACESYNVCPRLQIHQCFQKVCERHPEATIYLGCWWKLVSSIVSEGKYLSELLSVCQGIPDALQVLECWWRTSRG